MDEEELIVEVVKYLIEESSGIEPDEQILMHDWRAMKDDTEPLPIDPDACLDIHLYRRPPFDQMLYIVSQRGSDYFRSAHRGGATVTDLKRRLAWSFLVRSGDPLRSFALISPSRFFWARKTKGYRTFTMAAEDTFDMLVGRLELEGEQVTFGSDGLEFDNWKTLGEYLLTHAMLRISE
ncbi:unnamed protein product [Spirodela intermedia]|uniref:Uncharacterized protein n=1 Tax=Spirodela intermedia TaxID=51605 RepID=A0A7I8IKF1_SPIIN|nr:unnamed protein product [Spirodela intermedia]CAA6658243.1 unnamed protein product [Spirodela intermedia]